LRDVIAGQSRLLDQMTRKVASTDKTLETLSTKMDAFASTIKNQHNFNKIIDSQLAQLTAAGKRKDSRLAGRFRNYKSC
jgi:septal ring factor EnvC (AmiA/AmiB activator)